MFDKIQSTYFKRVTTGVLALFMTASSGFSYAVPVYAEEVTTAAARRKKEEEFSEGEPSTLKLSENNSSDESKDPLQKEADEERMIEDVLVAQKNGAKLFISKADQAKLLGRSAGDSEHMTTTTEKSDRFYKSGYIDVWVTDAADGSSGSQDKVTKARINISRDSAPSFSDGKKEATTWKCSLTIQSKENYHNLKLNQRSVTTKLAKFEGVDVYTVMNFSLSFTQHSHFQRATPNHYNRTYKFKCRLNFNYYDKANNGKQSLDTVLRHKDTAQKCNFQVNVVQAGLRTKDKVRYRGAIGKLKYYKPSHNVTFKYGYGDNNTYKTVSVVDGHKMTLPTNPTRSGYTFAGWSGDTSSIVCADRTITAKWTPWKHTIAYDTQGGTYDSTVGNNPNNYKIVKNGEYYLQLAADTSMYMHVKSASEDNGAIPVIYKGASASSPQSVWIFERYRNTPYYYIINKKSGRTLNAAISNDAKVHQWGQQNGDSHAENLWYLISGNNGEVYICNKNTNKVLDNQNAINANNNPILLYDKNNQANQRWKLVTVSQKDYPSRYKVTGANYFVNGVAPKKTGYKFLGWTTGKDGSGTLYKSCDQYTKDQNGGTVTLYAQWAKDSEAISWKHTIHYDKNATIQNEDGSTKEDDVSEMPEDQTKKFEVDLTLSKNIPIRKGYTFQKWSTNPDGESGDNYNPGSIYTKDQNGGTVTLYAQWKKNPAKHTLVYDTQGGINPNAGINGEYMISLGEGKNLTQNGSDIIVSNDTSDKSKWVIESSGNDDTYYIVNKENGLALYKDGENVKLGKQEKASLWFFYMDGNTVTIEDLKNEHSLFYDESKKKLVCSDNVASSDFTLNGTKTGYPSRTKVESQDIYVNEIAPTKKGCKFLGWSTASDETDSDDEEGDSEQDSKSYQPGDVYSYDQDGGTVTLYAKWERTSFNLSIDPNGGIYNGSSEIQTSTLDPGTAFSVGLPTKDKYNFAGYSVDGTEDGFPTDFSSIGYTNKHTDSAGTFSVEDLEGENEDNIIDYTSQKFSWTGIDSSKDKGTNRILYGKYAAQSSHTYRISGKITENTGSGNLVLNAYNTDGTTEYGSKEIQISSGNSSDFSFDTTFNKNVNAYLELRTKDASTLPSDISFIVSNLEITDMTTGKRVYGAIEGNMGTDDVTLTAQYEPWKHTVKYDANTSDDTVEGIPEKQEKVADESLTLNSEAPTRNGYTFLGWNTQTDGKGTAYAPGAEYTHDQDGGTVILYAQWTPWKHVLHYNKNVPTSSTSQTVSNMPVDQTKTFGQFMAISNLVPTRKGYTFAGWYTQSNGTGTKYNPGSNYAADQNGGTVNLYAKWTPWTYNIKYDQNVKSTSSSKTVTDMPAAQTKTQEIDVTLSSMTPKRNGYIFAGWSTSANGSVEYKPGSRFTKDLDSNGASITLYAVWTPWKHTVHYNSNIPTNAPTGTTTVSNMPNDQTKTFDEKLMISSNKPTRKGYNFAGWSTSANGNVVYQPGAEYKNDQNGGTVTLYAKWTAWKHTVTYDKNVPADSKKTDVKNMPENQTKIYDQNLTLRSNVPTRTGYTFVKWTTNKNGTGTAYQPGSQYSYNRDSDGGTVTLYAVWTPWKYTVRYDKNVPANSSSQTVSNMPADQTKTEEVNLTLSSNKPSRNGYIFNGWQAQINGKAVDYQPGATLSYDPDVKGSVITLKAKWTAWKHTIHYDKNVPASSSSQTVANMPEDDTKTFDITKTISSTKPSRNGYIFNGWNTQKDGKGTAYASGAAYKHDQNGGTVTLYAQWTPWKHTVTYDKNVDPSSSSQTVTNMPGNQTKTFDEKLMISSTKPSRNGYIFNGWNTQKDGKGTAYASGAEYKHDQNGNTVTLYAQWTAWKHTVHYNANGGDQNSVPTDQIKTFDQAMILSDKKPTRHGYNFVRWNTKADGTGTSYEVKGNYNHDQNGGTVTLYAIWTPWVHTVHYDANGGDQNSVPNDQKKTYGQSMNVATKVPTRNEYKFLGWTTGKDGSGTFYNPGDAYYHDQNGQTVTLYAKWIQLYTVKYDGNQPAIKGVTVTGSVANQTQGQDESVNLRTNNFKNDSGVYKDWSVGKDAYKYAVKNGTFRKYIHPEGYGTKHDTMQKELREYVEGMIRAQN